MNYGFQFVNYYFRGRPVFCEAHTEDSLVPSKTAFANEAKLETVIVSACSLPETFPFPPRICLLAWNGAAVF